MEVRSREDRRVGGHPEKLVTLEEAAVRLGLTPDDVEAMIQKGVLASFRLGGSLLRVRLGDVEAHRHRSVEEAAPGASAHRRYSPWERLVDFFYFNDFYIVVLLLGLTLLAIILTL